MRIDRWIMLFLLVVLAAVVQTPAGDVAAVGKQSEGESVVTLIDNATSTHVAVLNDLLTQVPEPAQAGLKRALESARKGHDVAMAALTEPTQPKSVRRDGRLDWTELMRARRTVSFSFHQSVSTLRKLMRNGFKLTPADAAEALSRVKESRDVALQSFDRLLAVRGPGLWGGSPGNLDGSEHGPRASRVSQQEGGGHCHGGNHGGGSQQGRPAGHT